MGNKERYIERIREKYPDREWADDEALFSQINDDYDEYEGELQKANDNAKSLTDLFAKDPRSAAFLMDWRNGEDPLIVLIRKYGDEFKEALQDPEKQEALAEANKEYAARIAKEEEYEQEYKKNLQQTYQTMDRMQQEEGLTEDDMDEAMVFLTAIMRDGIMGKFSPESIHMALKATRHDKDVAEADTQGEIRGRNTRIEEHLRTARREDATPTLAGKNGGGTDMPRRMPELGAIDRDFGSQNIWERGGERRFRPR